MTEADFNVRLERRLPAPPDRVFAAWTDRASLPAWLCPGSVVTRVEELDVRLGGRFRIIMQDDGEDLVHAGEYREVDPPRRLVFTWASPATGGRDTLVTVTLAPAGDGETDLTLTHERLPDADARHKHERGWSNILDKLAPRLTGG